jgi:hypothetical protein
VKYITTGNVPQDAKVDPLIRNELMGHVPAVGKGGVSLGTSANDAHTRPEARRRQLQSTVQCRSATSVMTDGLKRQTGRVHLEDEFRSHPMKSAGA